MRGDGHGCSKRAPGSQDEEKEGEGNIVSSAVRTVDGGFTRSRRGSGTADRADYKLAGDEKETPTTWRFSLTSKSSVDKDFDSLPKQIVPRILDRFERLKSDPFPTDPPSPLPSPSRGEGKERTPAECEHNNCVRHDSADTDTILQTNREGGEIKWRPSLVRTMSLLGPEETRLVSTLRRRNG